jgi:hypothetical protein
MTMWKWLQHKTNPAHVWCRLLTLLYHYDKLWRRVFCRGTGNGFTKKELVALTKLIEKRRRLEKEKNRLLNKKVS